MKPLAACLLTFAFGHCHAELSGRLFFTPAERLAADQPTPATYELARQRLDGMLQLPDGQRLYWIDGSDHRQAPPRLAVGDSSDNPLLPPGSVQIQPGKKRQ